MLHVRFHRLTGNGDPSGDEADAADPGTIWWDKVGKKQWVKEEEGTGIEVWYKQYEKSE